MDGTGTMILSLAALIALSAFFSASETAYTSLNRVRVKNMANAGNRRAAKVLRLAERYDKLLSGILVGNNIVNILSASLATVLFVNLMGGQGVSVSTAVMTVVVPWGRTALANSVGETRELSRWIWASRNPGRTIWSETSTSTIPSYWPMPTMSPSATAISSWHSSLENTLT